VAIHLTVAENEFTMVDAKIFEDEKYEIGKIHFEKSGTYKVNFQTIYGCDSLVQLNLDYYEVYFPNAFSPNGDEFNDIFTVAGNNDLKAILSFRIFNRWGEIVYDEINVPDESGSKGWDGNTNKIPAPNGIYVYTTTLLMNDNQERARQGTFLLVR
jgi:gliding motility-associated-like protein